MGRCEGEKSKLEDTVNILRNLQQQIGVENINVNRDPTDRKTDVPQTEDVFILHDSLFKEISTGLLKKEEISVKKLWTPRIYDALEAIRNLTEKPKFVYLHCGTNDLEEIDPEQMVSDIGEIYNILKGRDIKFAWSNIIPRRDTNVLNAKAELVNAMVGIKLMNKDGAYIVRVDNFYLRDAIIPEYFNEDGVHITGRGITILAQNARAAICRCLNVEFVKKANHSTRSKRKDR